MSYFPSRGYVEFCTCLSMEVFALYFSFVLYSVPWMYGAAKTSVDTLDDYNLV